MAATITVKGTGSASARPDQIIISLSLRTINKDYQKSMNTHSRTLSRLNKALSTVGFAKEDLKTTSFSVQTEYSSVKDKDGNYKRVFDGYCINNSLKLEFAFDTKHLAEVLSAIASADAEPEIRIAFSVKDKENMKNEMLKDAAKNARARAEVLCAASGTKLGRLVNIGYSWNDVNFYSRTSFMEEDCCFEASPEICSCEIEPEDVNISDSVSFVWEME